MRCWRYDWVLDLDIKSFFDSIDWELLLKAVRHHTDCSWALLYVDRWLKAPEQIEDGSVVSRIAGTPQGGVESSLGLMEVTTWAKRRQSSAPRKSRVQGEAAKQMTTDRRETSPARTEAGV
jgi:retron-type reverse transcriptase